MDVHSTFARSFRIARHAQRRQSVARGRRHLPQRRERQPGLISVARNSKSLFGEARGSGTLETIDAFRLFETGRGHSGSGFDSVNDLRRRTGVA